MAGVRILGLGQHAVQVVSSGSGYQHGDANDENPDQQLDLHHGISDAQKNESDQGHARYPVGLETVGAWPHGIPALSPVQSAITPGLRASSSLILKTIFIRSAPISAILVKMPPATRSAAAPSDSPMAKPMKHLPAYSCGTSVRMPSMKASSMLMSSMPMLIPALSGMAYTGNGLPFRLAKAVRLFANVF